MSGTRDSSEIVEEKLERKNHCPIGTLKYYKKIRLIAWN